MFRFGTYRRVYEEISIICLFLIFIPFFIVSGFYIFYKNSFRPILFGGKLAQDTDFNKGGLIMDTVKTIFISSIISYLIVKIIEIISAAFL